jgi:hypothetical protein
MSTMEYQKIWRYLKSWGIPKSPWLFQYKVRVLDDFFWGVPCFRTPPYDIYWWWSKLDEHPRNRNEQSLRYYSNHQPTEHDKNSGDVAAPRILLLSNGRAKHGWQPVARWDELKSMAVNRKSKANIHVGIVELS